MNKKRENSVKTMQHAASGIDSLQLGKLGVHRFDLKDPYHLALTMSWPQFLFGLLIIYCLINAFFALLYWSAPGSVANMRAGSFSDAFYFSIETLATVGYGNMAPITAFSHMVSAIEVLVGMLLTATMTGLVFVRFSKPKAKLMFASHAVVTRSQGGYRLMIRIGNGRMYPLLDAQVRVTTLVLAVMPDGQRFRSMVDLTLTRDDLPYFPLMWTLTHEINDDSPLASLRSMDVEQLQNSATRLLVSITARDPALGAQVHAQHAYGTEHIAVGMHYQDAISGLHDNHSVADMRKLSDMAPDQLTAEESTPSSDTLQSA
jgi:inward rectifier potassium channel